MRRSMTYLCVLGVIAAAIASPAGATASTTEAVPIDFSVSPPLLSAACGFPVTRHVEGTLRIRTFYDAQGSVARELAQYHLVQTVWANGLLDVVQTVGDVRTDVAAICEALRP